MAGPRDIDETDDEEVLDPNEGADAGQVYDEGGDDAEAGQEFESPEAEERVAPRARRADEQHNALVQQELALLRQEREALRQEREARQRPQEETEEQFLARIALLEPEMRWDAKLDRALKNNARQTALAQFAAADRADKAVYDAKAATNALYRKHAAAVESTMADARRRGIDINRETALGFVLGQAVLNNQGKVSPAKAAGQQRIASQQARTTGGRGDQRRDERPRRYAAGDMSPEAVRSRLEAPDAYI